MSSLLCLISKECLSDNLDIYLNIQVVIILISILFESMPNIVALNNRFRLLNIVMKYLFQNKIHSSSNDFFLLLLIRLMEMDSSEYIGLTIPRSSFIIDTIDLSKPYNSIDWSRLNLTVTLGLESCETTVSYTFNCRIVKIHPKFSNIIRIWWIEFSFWNSYWKLLITESGQGNTLKCLRFKEFTIRTG